MEIIGVEATVWVFAVGTTGFALTVIVDAILTSEEMLDEEADDVDSKDEELDEVVESVDCDVTPTVVRACPSPKFKKLFGPEQHPFGLRSLSQHQLFSEEQLYTIAPPLGLTFN